MIKLEHYKIFNEAATTLSFSIAARNLFISQSAVSQTINLLEKSLHTRLFNRIGKGVTLTREGEILHQSISQALTLITNAENQMSNINNLNEGQLTLAASDTFSEFFLLPFVSSFHHHYPNVKITLINRTSLEINELLKNGEIDLGFINLPHHDDTLSVFECFTMQDIFVSSYPIEETLSFNDLSKLPLILLEQSSYSRRYIDQFSHKQGVRLKPLFEVGSHQLLLEFAKKNLGIACVIREFAYLDLASKHLYEITISDSIPQRSMGCAYLSKKTSSAPAIKFMELLKTNHS